MCLFDAFIFSSGLFPRVTKAKVNEYYEKIEAVASKIASQVVSHLRQNFKRLLL